MTPKQEQYCWFYMVPNGYRPMIRCMWYDIYTSMYQYDIVKPIIPQSYIRNREKRLELVDPFTVMFGTQVMLKITDPEEVSIVGRAMLMYEKDEIDYSRDQLPF